MSEHREPSRISHGALVASAIVLVAMILVHAGKTVPTANAEMVSQVGEFSVMTTDGGNEEVLLVLDKRTEDLSVYRVVNQNSLEMHQRVNLGRVFADAKAKAQGRR